MNPNQRAIVLLVSYGSADMLLTADAESDVTVPLRPPPVEILKVAHHGSADPRLDELLRLVRPRIALISVGADNTYGHPAPSTLAALRAAQGRRWLAHLRHAPGPLAWLYRQPTWAVVAGALGAIVLTFVLGYLLGFAAGSPDPMEMLPSDPPQKARDDKTLMGAPKP